MEESGNDGMKGKKEARMSDIFCLRLPVCPTRLECGGTAGDRCRITFIGNGLVGRVVRYRKQLNDD